MQNCQTAMAKGLPKPCSVACCLFFVSFWLGAEVYPQTPVDSVSSDDISLADWGLQDPSEIGFVSVGILHERDGGRLIVYDIRKRKPVLPEPTGLRSRRPEYDGDFFLVGHFNRGNTNRLGGYFNGFARAPSKSFVSIKKAPNGSAALAYSYSNTQPGFSGFWIHLFDFKKPPAERVLLDARSFKYLTFSVRGDQGGENIVLQMADRIWEKKEDSLPIGSLASFLPAGKIKKTWQQAYIPLSQMSMRLDISELASIVFRVEGNGAGQIHIKDLAFSESKGTKIAPIAAVEVPPRKRRKAMWLWEVKKITANKKSSQQLISFCHSQDITDLFIQIPYEATQEGSLETANRKWTIEWDPTTMRPLIAQLHHAGINVHALDGDPRYATEAFHGRVLALIERIIEYNRTALPEERFVGVRYDNEPYLLPSFAGIQKESILRQYLSLLEKSQAMANQGDLEFGVDIPFWFDALNEFFEPTAALDGRPMSELIIDIVDNIGIMAYRTQAYGADGTITHSSDELRYANKMNKDVWVGLETVWLPDESMYEFSPKGRGSKLLIETTVESKVRLIWVPAGEDIGATQAVVLNQTRKIMVPASKLTFNDMSMEDFENVMLQTEDELQTFSSYQGLIIHSYESFRPWLEKQSR